MDRLSPLDASFLHVEDDVTHMHAGSVSVFDGPAPGYEELTTLVRGRLPLVPRYRQRVHFVPYGLGRPVWVDDRHFNLAYHLRHTALPPPGGAAELHALTGRVMSQKLDLTKPLWEIWVVEGLDAGAWALIVKAHHALVDGIAGTELLSVLLDDTPDPSRPVPDTWRPNPALSNRRLLTDAVTDYLVSPYESWQAIRSILRRPGRQLRRFEELARGLGSMAGLARSAADTSLVGPIGPHRRFGTARVSLADVRVVRDRFGGTVNDVVVSVVTRGLRDLLLARGEPPDGRALRALFPFSVRDASQPAGYANDINAAVLNLPVNLADPVERLRAVQAEMTAVAASGQTVAAETLTSLYGFAPPLLLALATRAVSRAARGSHRGVGTVLTNAPGPKRPLFALGRRLTESFPYQPIAGPARVGVAAFSYDDQLGFGVTGDFDTVPDLAVVCDGIEAGASELMPDRVSRRAR